MKKQITSERAPAAIGPYSQAINVGKLIFVSGQIAIDSKSGLVQGDIREQTQIVLSNLDSIIKAANCSLDNVVKTTVFLADIKDFDIMNQVYSDFFTGVPPARSAFQVANLPKGARVEIEAIAVSD